jgi:hypothetical protein
MAAARACLHRGWALPAVHVMHLAVAMQHSTAALSKFERLSVELCPVDGLMHWSNLPFPDAVMCF